MSDPSHRPEPEIIPPGAADPSKWQDQRRGGGGDARVWMWASDQQGARLRYGRPGPLGLIMIFAALAALGALGFFVFLGALAIAIPVIATVVFIGLVAGVLRRL
jgi:hypothetical protein